MDEDGFYFLTGRVKDYFKTIQGKFVAPTPIENTFAENDYTSQLCLLGRGYSKTVMICVLSEFGKSQPGEEVEAVLRERVAAVNGVVDKHARIGAVIVARDPWLIENGVLTPTLKIRREKLDELFGTQAEELARQAAEQGDVLVEFL